MYKIYLFIIILFSSFSLQAQDIKIEDAGPVREDRNLKGTITNIKAFQNVNVFLSQSDSNKINVEVGHVDLFKKVKTSIVSDTLIISVDEIYYTNKLYEHPINVYIDIKKVNSITANSNSRIVVSTPLASEYLVLESTLGGKIEFKNEVTADNLKLTSTLSGSVTSSSLFTLDTASLTVGTKASVSMNLNVANSLECYVTNQSSLSLLGAANNVLVTCQDKSIAKMKDFKCEYANAFATYEGSITIIPDNTLTATATYKGIIYTSKKVKNLIKSESTQGKVRL